MSFRAFRYFMIALTRFKRDRKVKNRSRMMWRGIVKNISKTEKKRM